jgi:hypothetical protein
MVITRVGIDALDEAVEEGDALVLSALAGVVALPGQGG